MKTPRLRLILAYGLIAVVLATALVWRAKTSFPAPLAANRSATEASAAAKVTPPALGATLPTAQTSQRTAEEPQNRQSGQQQAFQALPKTEQESLWSAFASARRAVQPLTDHEASLPHNTGVRYFAQNPSQQLTARFLDGAVRIESGRGGKWAASLSLAEADKTQPVLADGRVEYHHANGITEWYENRAEGVEHAFTVSRRPDEASPELRLPLALQGVQASLGEGEQAGTITFADPTTGTPVLSYGTLKVWDANGRELAAHYETHPQGLDIVVADAGAAYPITIDPLIATQEAKQGPEVTGDGKADDAFGFTVALDENTALIGTPGDDTVAGVDSGSAYVFTRSVTTWTQQAKLRPNSPAGTDNFGISVALSGNTALVGAYSDDTTAGSDAGSAYVFTRSGTAWTQQAKLNASDAASGDLLGSSVALSGNTALIGAVGDDLPTAVDAGSAYVFTRSGTVWTQQAKLTASDAAGADSFGKSVALSGETALVGAPWDDTAAGNNVGSAYVFTRSGNVWSQQTKLTAADAETQDFFGESVAISGDTALVGSYRDNDSAGSVYAFTRSDTVWSQQAILAADDGQAYSYFGISMALSGDTALVGAYLGDKETVSGSPGSAYIFTRSGTVWSQQAKLTASDATDQDSFGISVALSGDTALVGAYHDDTPGGSNAGSAYVFTRNGSTWSQESKLTTDDASVSDYFGCAVALSGDTALIGASGDDTVAGSDAGSAYIFSRNGTVWNQRAKLTASDAESGDNFGKSVALDGDMALVGAFNNDLHGSAYIFTRSGTVWSQQAKLTANDAAMWDYFGYSVALSGNTALVGVSKDDTTAGSDVGSAYVFTRSGTVWSQQAKLNASDAEAADNFGNSVALDGDTALVGTYMMGAYYNNDRHGSAYVFTRSGTVWSQQAKLNASDANWYWFYQFGHSVALSGDTALVGAPWEETTAGPSVGSAYVFTRSGTIWSQQAKLTASDAASGDYFGLSLALSGDTVLVGADRDDTPQSVTNDPRADHGSVYVFRLAVPQPEIALSGNGVNIADGDTTPSLADHTDFGGVNITGGSSTRTFTITNPGSETLSLTGVPRVSLSGSSAFSVTQQPASATVAANGGTQTFQIIFDPASASTDTATISIANNDVDENPFDIQVSGTGITEPEIEVESPSATALESGNVYNFGTTTGYEWTPHSFTIHNTGNAALTGLAISVSGPNSEDFSLETEPPDTLNAGDSSTFSLAFYPSGAGSRNATLAISNNDADENPFIIQLHGTGIISPHIRVLDGSVDMINGYSTLAFGIVGAGRSLTRTITVINSGNAALNISAEVVGDHGAEFLVGSMAESVPVGGTSTFDVRFTPQAVGARTATLYLFNNDYDSGDFEIALTGTQLPPEGPTFILQPQSRIVRLGSPANFESIVSGDPAITFQWKKGSANILNAVNNSYSIAITKTTDAAAYSVIADNPVGAPVPSQTAYLGLMTLSEGGQVLKTGGELKLRCTFAAPLASGVSVSYAWRRSGNVLSNGTQANLSVITGADKAALSITKIGTENAGTYTCLVTLNTPGNDPQATNGDTFVEVVGAVPVLSPIPLPAIVSVSQPIDALITASNFPTGFSLVGLPAGLKFDTKTGRLYGRPTVPSKKNAAGTAYIPNKLTFKATNPFNAGPALDFYLTIEALDPTIVGTFNGVVSREGYSNFGMGGYVQITVANTGLVSGSATLAGQKHSVVGVLDISVGNDPTAELLIKRTPATLGDLELTINIVRGNDLMQGTITDPEFEIVSGGQDLGGPDTPGFLNGPVEDALFNGPRGIALLPNGDGYLADTGNHLIRKVADDTVTTFAGTAEAAGESNGTGTAASFESPEGLALDPLGNLYVADTGNATIRKITALGVVTTFAGTADQIGNTNATGADARFNMPSALCFDPAGNLYVADRGNHTIRKITSAGVVTTLAGKADIAGHKDGGGSAALFNTPRGIVYEPVAKALFVTDSGNNVIRKITLTGTVTTHAGSPGVEGYADGLLANARFIEPMGIATVGNGILIVGDKVLRQINPNGVVGAVTGYVDLNGLDQPVALAFSESDEVLLAVHNTLHGVSIHQPTGMVAEAMFDARRNPWTAASNVAQMGGYTAGIETSAAPGDLGFPQGDGYATLAISKTGVATWVGKAADGTGLTFGTIMAADLSIPLHVMMYKNTGSLQGECFINATTLDLVSDVIPAFDWYKIPQPLASTDRSYKGGFLVHPLELSGGKYTPNNIYTFLGLAGAPANLTMDFSEAGLTAFSEDFTIATPNTVNVPTNPSTATLKIDPKTGIYTGSFKTGSPAVTSNFTGVIIDYEAGNAKRGYGHFLLPESTAATAPLTSGRVRLEK